MSRSLQWQFDLAKNQTASYYDQIPFQTSPSSSRSLLLPHTFGFSFLVLNLGWKVFYQWYLHFMIFRFSSPSSSTVERFFINWSFVWFSSSVSHWVRRFFTSDMTLWDSSASLWGLDILNSLPVFLPSLPHRVGRFFTRFHFFWRFYAQWSLCPKKEIIVITWASDQRVPEAEVMWQQSSGTSPWSVWPPSWRLTQSGSHLEP